ncbi:MarR family winged helix-turn-helix transcriptional regulator [Lysinibacillus sp. NPDC097287]|uniref:MarR family winged helix-turn-helix transcriptional regulator n=1 Tax=Lysinibacillus sp. NPDC097287 TaxID=3364144 RepID=UPI003822DF72
MKPTEKYISYLINHSSTVLQSAVKKQFAPYNLAPEQSLVLAILRRENGLTQYEIGEKLKKDKANIARMADNLEKKGFIERIRDPNNRRALKLYLTAQGEKTFDEALTVFKKFDDEISSRVTAEELSEFKRILYKLTSEK